MKRVFIILALTGAIAACGGGSDSGSNTQQPSVDNPPTSATKTGILTDGVVSGVSYETNSGLKGVTNDNGEFKYNEGDKVTFTISTVQLGDTITARARITPLDLAEDNDSRTNLLVFLQSFDSDSNHDNGISISDKAIEALKDQTINFKQNPNTFVDDLTFRKAIAKAELTQSITPDQAQQNFRQAFYKDIAGVWQLSENQNSQSPDVLLYISEDGKFYFGQFTLADSAGKPGIEVGQLNWNSINTSISPSISIDTNGEWGLSDPNGHHTLNFDGTKLILGEPAENNATYSLTKVANKENSLVGAWKSSTEGPVFAFLENGTYLMLDPVGDTMVEEGDEPCGGAGIELGKYTINNTNLLISNISIDTNECAGLSGQNSGIAFNVQSDKLSFTPRDEDTFILDRIK